MVVVVGGCDGAFVTIVVVVIVVAVVLIALIAIVIHGGRHSTLYNSTFGQSWAVYYCIGVSNAL